MIVDGGNEGGVGVSAARRGLSIEDLALLSRRQGGVLPSVDDCDGACVGTGLSMCCGMV